MVSKVDAALLQAMHYKEHNAICDKCDKVYQDTIDYLVISRLIRC